MGESDVEHWSHWNDKQMGKHPATSHTPHILSPLLPNLSSSSLSPTLFSSSTSSSTPDGELSIGKELDVSVFLKCKSVAESLRASDLLKKGDLEAAEIGKETNKPEKAKKKWRDIVHEETSTRRTDSADSEKAKEAEVTTLLLDWIIREEEETASYYFPATFDEAFHRGERDGKEKEKEKGLQNGQGRDGAEIDPERVILFEDISDILFSVTSEYLKIQMFFVFLHFLGAFRVSSVIPNFFFNYLIQTADFVDFDVLSPKLFETLTFQQLHFPDDVARDDWRYACSRPITTMASLIPKIQNVFLSALSCFPASLILRHAFLCFLSSIYPVNEMRTFYREVLRHNESNLDLWVSFAKYERTNGSSLLSSLRIYAQLFQISPCWRVDVVRHSVETLLALWGSECERQRERDSKNRGNDLGGFQRRDGPVDLFLIGSEYRNDALNLLCSFAEEKDVKSFSFTIALTKKKGEKERKREIAVGAAPSTSRILSSRCAFENVIFSYFSRFLLFFLDGILLEIRKCFEKR